MAKPKAQTAPSFLVSESAIAPGSVWVPIWCGKHHFENLKTGVYNACGCPPGPQVRALATTAREISLGGPRGISKGQPLDAKVSTPFGWTEMGALRVGSQLSNPDGTVSRLIGVYPLGERDIFEFTFADGAKTRVTDDHLWLGKLTCREMKADRKYAPFAGENRVGYKIFTTDFLRQHLAAQEDQVQPSNFLIPLSQPVEFTRGRNQRFVDNWPPVHPYALGLLIGDGSLTGRSIAFTTADPELIEALRILTNATWKSNPKRPIEFWSSNYVELKVLLAALGLIGKTSPEKFIPECYKYASIETRLELLRGLMDTDGWAIDGASSCQFGTSSQQLALDVQFIARSLGAKAGISSYPSSYVKNGERVQCRESYKVYIQAEDCSRFFRLERKRKRCALQFNGGVSTPHRRLVSIEHCGRAQAQCIAVDHPNQLYITDDFIVTHNTETGRGFLLKGNQCWEEPTQHTAEQHMEHLRRSGFCGWCVNASYTNHPMYRVLVLREDEKDLADWLRRAKLLYEPLGADVTEKPARVRFNRRFVNIDGMACPIPGGAEFILGHMKDETDHQGQEYHRMICEELTQNSKEQMYVDLNISCRSTFHCYANCGPGACTCGKLKPQTMVMYNWGGAGHQWVRKRFWDIGPPDVLWTNPDPARKDRTRIFISGSLDDNPYIDESYKQELEELKDTDYAKYRAWRWGDPDAFAGQYFTTFRPNGPLSESEPAEARHIIAAVPLRPWWNRSIGIDWGFNHESAVYWLCSNEDDKRLHVYDELVINEIGPDELGALVARRTFKDIERYPEIHFNIFLSFDCFNRIDDGPSKAQQFQSGIERILGPRSAFVMFYNETEQRIKLENPELAWAKVEERRELAASACFTIHRSSRDREGGWQEIRRMLRFLPLAPQDAKPDAAYCEWLKKQEDGINKVAAYLREQDAGKEILPKIQIWDCCPKLKEQMIAAIHEEGTEDILEDGKAHSNDRLDALRYGILGHRDVKTKPPRSAFRAERLLKYGTDASLTDKMFIVSKADRDYDSEWEDVKPFTIPRFGSRASLN
jgi:hypothetical protein